MAYRIVYGPEPSAARRRREPKSIRPILTACFFLMFLVMVRTLWPEGGKALALLLLPGDPEVTGQAFQVMMESMEQGSGLGTAFAAFCREVLRHGTVY